MYKYLLTEYILTWQELMVYHFLLKLNTCLYRNKTIKITPKVPKTLINNILIRLIGIKTLNFIPIQLKLYINNEVTINLNVIFFNNRNILITIINYDIKLNLFNYFSII